MAFGDMGGTLNDAIITCQARGKIHKGNAVTLTEGDFCVTNDGTVGFGPLFGQAMNDAEDMQAISVKFRGLCEFTFPENHLVDRNAYLGLAVSLDPGKVVSSQFAHGGLGRVLKVDEAAKLVHVLL